MADYCTSFDHRYLIRGLTLYQSLVVHSPPFRLWVLCLSQRCFLIMGALKLPHVRLLSLHDLELADPELSRTAPTRSLVEYYFTCTPSFVRHLLLTQPDVGTLTYLDADLYFFADPAPIFEEFGAHSIGIIPHRFPPAFADMAREHGRYNVGWLTFRRDAAALACLDWWRERCLEWCYDRVEDGKYADQKYLDQWPDRFAGVVVLRHPGANLAPWNLSTHHLASTNGNVSVDGQPLLFFHFHRLRQIRSWLYAPRLTDFAARATPLVRDDIYVPYLKALRRTHQTLLSSRRDVRLMDSVREQNSRPPEHQHGWSLRHPAAAAARALEVGRRVLAREYFILVGNHVV